MAWQHTAVARRTTSALAAVVLLVTASGCSDGDPATSPSQSSSSAVPTPTPTRPAPPPREGQCHDLSFTAATKPVDDRPAAKCGQEHTSITFHVGRLDRIRDGHLVAVDSATVQDQLNATCRGRLAEFLGGDQQSRRLSRFEVVWFRPSVKESDRGASWYRCDAVAVADTRELATLPDPLRGILDSDEGLDRFGTCGTAAPDKPDFRRVLCSAGHRWRAVSIIDLPQDAHYVGKNAGADASDACKAEASKRADGALKFTWSFEWPTRKAWDEGQRYGYCWIPATD